MLIMIVYVCSTCDHGKFECAGTPCAPPTCSPREFTCNDSRCIPDQWVCDKVPDCDDGEDELNCGECHSAAVAAAAAAIYCPVKDTV